MDISHINRLLWVSILLIFWGLAGMIVEGVSKGTQITPDGLPGATMFLIGMLVAAVGQVLFRQAARIEVLEKRLEKLSERVPKE